MINKFFDYFFSTALYRQLFLKRKAFIFRKKVDLSILNSLYYKGHIFLYNELEANGVTYIVKDFLDINKLPKNVINKLHRFFWLSSLRVLNTMEAEIKALSLVELWSDKYKYFQKEVWEADVLADRVFQLVLCYNFYTKRTNSVVCKNITLLINDQISHLINLYYLNKWNLYSLKAKLKIAKAFIIVAIASEKYGFLIPKSIALIEADIKENILNDGGHVSRNPHAALIYLEDLLIVFYMLKDNGKYNIDSVVKAIDRVSLFIRSMRHGDGTLAVFNGGYESTKNITDYLLSLSKSSSSPSFYLRYSGYIRLSTSHISLICDVGSSSKHNNALLAFELSINKDKIIVNLGDNLLNIKDTLLQDELWRLNNSCLILKINNKITYLPFSEDTLTVEHRTEENWERIKISYSGLKDLGITYHRTLFLSRNKYTYILGEDMLTVQRVPGYNLQEAYLRFNFSPKIKAIQLFKKGTIASFEVGDMKYVFVSNDNSIKTSKNMRTAEEGEIISCYTLDIPFDLKSKIIKNEWSLAIDDDKNKLVNDNAEVIKILDIVDMQNSFLTPEGLLKLEGSSSLITATNDFFSKIGVGVFDFALVKQDTHFKNEYDISEESQHFPFHCEYKSLDWELAIDTNLLKDKMPVYKMYKNTLDMWQSDTNNQDEIVGLDYKYRTGYQSLYKILPHDGTSVICENMDELLDKFSGKKIEVYMLGVASDYCVKYAMEGYLRKGITVHIIKDLTKGITQEIGEVIRSSNYSASELLNIKIVNTDNFIL